MVKIVTMHQPNYLPWIGLFSKVSQADCLIIYDTAQFTSGGMIHRNRIRTKDGWCYLTIPVKRSFHSSRILDIPLPPDKNWRDNHWKTISQNYARAPFFPGNEVFFRDLYVNGFVSLGQMNEAIIRHLLKVFSIDIEVVVASSLGMDPQLTKTDRLIGCLKSVGADVYLSGPSGRGYLEMEKFRKSGMSVVFSQFRHPMYRQRYPGFEPNMSAIDLLFNKGREANDILRASATVV